MNTRRLIAAAAPTSIVILLAAGCASASSHGNQSVPDVDDAAPAPIQDQAKQVALISGTLRDPTTAQQTHDGAVAQVEPIAEQLGDIGHFTGVGDAPSASAEVLILDLWSTTDGPSKLYGSSGFQQAAGSLFAARPQIALAAQPDGWTTWGDMDYRSAAAKVYFVTISGPPPASLADARSAHNDAVGQLGPVASGQGDVGHFVLLAGADGQGPAELTFVDYWLNATAPQSFYSSPQAQQAFAGVFAGPPKIAFYASTSWQQW